MNAHLLYPIKNAEAAKLGDISLSEVGIRSLDAKTLEVTLERPTPYFLELVAFCVFFPINAKVDHSHPEWDLNSGKNFICSGPFLLQEWKRNNQIVLVKNPNYFKANEVRLEKICLNTISSEMTSLHMFEKGQIDILGQPLIPLPTDAIPDLIKNQKLQAQEAAATTFCSFNVDTYPFNNCNIRKAFSCAINRKTIVRNLTQLNERPAVGIIPPILKKNRPSLLKPLPDGDTLAAKAYFEKGLSELNLKKEQFPKIKYLYPSSEAHHKIAQVLQQQWRDVLGVHVGLEQADRAILMQLLKTRSYQIAQSFWMAQYNDPMNILERFKSPKNVKNYPNWENEEFVSLLNASSETETDEERFALLEKAEEKLLEEMPLTPIFHWSSAYIVKPYVKSLGSFAIGNGFFDRVYIDTEMKQNMR